MKRTHYTFKGQTINNAIHEEDFKIMDLNEIKILGGEPFLDKRYIDIFKKIDAENINLFFVTNNSIFPNKEWIEQLKRFKHINFNISIDGIHEVAEFVRYGTKFTKFEKNYKKWLNLNFHNMDIIPHFVFHSLNILNFDQTVDWLMDIYDLELEAMLKYISYDFLSQPEILTDECKNMIVNNSVYFKDELENFLETNSFNLTHINELKKFVSFLNLRNEIPDQSFQVISCLK